MQHSILIRQQALKVLTLFACFSLFSIGAQAKRFTNSYVSFELPPQWECSPENTAYVCRYSVPASCEKGPDAGSAKCKAEKKKTKEAIIILTAKEVGAKDSFQTYTKHLNTPRTIITRTGAKANSKVYHVKAVSIEKHKWIDGMHLGSEIPHYYTRYLATIKGKIAVLVTFSAHKLYYTKYNNAFFEAIKSLRVVASQVDAMKPGDRPNKSDGTLGPGDVDFPDDMYGDTFNDGEPTGDGSSSNLLFFAAFILAALGIYIWIKGRR